MKGWAVAGERGKKGVKGPSGWRVVGESGSAARGEARGEVSGERGR